YSAGRMKSTLQPALLPLLRQRQAGARSPARLAEPIARTRARSGEHSPKQASVPSLFATRRARSRRVRATAEGRKMGQPRVILLELNELSPTLVDRFIGEKRLPAFQQCRAESHVYVSESAERAPYLDPWIQWITVHTGLDYADHQIFHLGDGTKLSRPSLWDLLSDEGRTVWVCGSMNVNYRKPLRGAVLPDPWAIDLVPQPRELGPYYSFTRRQVLEHTNPDAQLRPQDYLAFAHSR